MAKQKTILELNAEKNEQQIKQGQRLIPFASERQQTRPCYAS